MPVIDATEHDYTVTLRDGRRVTLNYYDFQGAASLSGTGETPDQLKKMVDAVRPIVSLEPDDAEISDAELMGVISLMGETWKTVGNVVEPQQGTLRPTDGSHVSAA
jgi:hypothetical protein